MHRPWCQRDHGIDDDLSTKICIQLCAIVFDSSDTGLSWWTVTQRLLVLTMICVIDSTLMNCLLRLVFSIWSCEACLCFVFPIYKICKYFSSIVHSYDIVGIYSSDGGKIFFACCKADLLLSQLYSAIEIKSNLCFFVADANGIRCTQQSTLLRGCIVMLSFFRPLWIYTHWRIRQESYCVWEDSCLII